MIFLWDCRPLQKTALRGGSICHFLSKYCCAFTVSTSFTSEIHCVDTWRLLKSAECARVQTGGVLFTDPGATSHEYSILLCSKFFGAHLLYTLEPNTCGGRRSSVPAPARPMPIAIRRKTSMQNRIAFFLLRRWNAKLGL